MNTNKTESENTPVIYIRVIVDIYNHIQFLL
jgi:hypothetical protein